MLCCLKFRALRESLLALDRLGVALALALLTASAFTLAACGRNGDPLPPLPAATEMPPGPVAAPSPVPGASSDASGAAPTAPTNVQKNGFDSFGNPVAPAGQKKSFLLDPILQ
jgi:hypothetical protein